MKKTFLIVLLVLLCTVSVFAAGKAEEAKGSVTWRFSAVDAATSDYIKAYRAMWDRVERETGGAIKVEIYDLNQLGDEPDVLQSLQGWRDFSLRRIGYKRYFLGISVLFNVNDLHSSLDDLITLIIC